MAAKKRSSRSSRRGSRSSRRSHGDASRHLAHARKVLAPVAYGLSKPEIRAIFRRQLAAFQGERADAYNATLDVIAGPYDRNMPESKHKKRMALAAVLRGMMNTEPGVPQPNKRAKYQQMTQRPGKFEGEAAYIPYFYELEMDGGGDSRGERTLFHVTAKDRDIFPELKGRKTVWLHHTDQGSVVEG